MNWGTVLGGESFGARELVDRYGCGDGLGRMPWLAMRCSRHEEDAGEHHHNETSKGRALHLRALWRHKGVWEVL
jgi:hypothetical protein